MKIKDKVAVITGGSFGLGKDLAYKLASEGAEVILLARTTEKLKEVSDDIIAKGGKAHYYPVDLMSLDVTKSVIEQIKREHGAPDILANSATLGDWKYVEESSFEDFDIHTTVAYLGTARMCVGFINEMLPKKEACIINFVSGGDKARFPGAAAYLASKAAVTAFTEALRIEMWGTKVNVMLFSAGKIGDTNYFNVHQSSEARIPAFAKIIPTVTSERCVNAIVKGIKKNKKEVFVPLMMKISYFFMRTFPRTMRWIIGKTGYSRKEFEKEKAQSKSTI